jgi:hypothetical protein
VKSLPKEGTQCAFSQAGSYGRVTDLHLSLNVLERAELPRSTCRPAHYSARY